MSYKKEVLTFQVKIISEISVKGKAGEAQMILFNGSADCENFKGEILSGGVDTQKELYGKNRTLSARYILDGEDNTGQKCKIFVENNGTVEDGVVKTTTPRIFTDSEALSFLEISELSGTISSIEGGVEIHIFCEIEEADEGE